MIWVGSATQGNGEKLSDAIFRRLAEPDDTSWETVAHAEYLVKEAEMDQMARILAVLYDLDTVENGKWNAKYSHSYKAKIVRRYLQDLTTAARAVRNNEGARRLVEEYLVMPMGLYVRPDAIQWKEAEGLPLVVR